MHPIVMLYNILALGTGALCKLNDDIKDSIIPDLPKKEGGTDIGCVYVQQLAQNLFGIGFVILSLAYPYFYVFFMTTGLMDALRMPNEYGPFEITGIIAGSLLLAFIPSEKFKACFNKEKLLFLYIPVLLASLLDNWVHMKEDAEYSEPKLGVRAIGTLALITLLIVDCILHVLCSQERIIVLFGLGYIGTSVVYQITRLSTLWFEDDQDPKVSARNKDLTRRSLRKS